MNRLARLRRAEREQQRIEAYLDAMTPAQWLTLCKTDATLAIEQKGLAYVVDSLDAQGMHPDWVAFFTDEDLNADRIEAMSDANELPEGEEVTWDWKRLSEGELPLP